MATVQHLPIGVVISVMILLSSVHGGGCSIYIKHTDGCEQYTAAVQSCVKGFHAAVGTADIPTICRLYNVTLACMARAPTCDHPPEDSKHWTSAWDANEHWLADTGICSHSTNDTSCGNFEAQAYSCLFTHFRYPGSGPEEICSIFQEAQQCMNPLVSRCPDDVQGGIAGRYWHDMSPFIIQFCDEFGSGQ